MADQYKKPYFDTSIFCAWIAGEKIEVTPGSGITRKQVADHVFNLASKGAYIICTSYLTMVEAFKPRQKTEKDDELAETIFAFFEQDYIRPIELNREISENANRLCRDLNLKACDAIHLASAIFVECDVLLAWDKKFVNKTHPRIRIEEPQIIGQLEFTKDILKDK